MANITLLWSQEIDCSLLYNKAQWLSELGSINCYIYSSTFNSVVHSSYSYCYYYFSNKLCHHNNVLSPRSANHIIMCLSNWLCLLLFTHLCHSIHKTTLWDHLFCRLKKEDLNQVLFWFQNHWNFILIHTLKTFSGSYIVPEFWHNKFHNTVI